MPFVLSSAIIGPASWDRYFAHLGIKRTEVTRNVSLDMPTIDEEHEVISVVIEKDRSPTQCNCRNGGSVVPSVPPISRDVHLIFGYITKSEKCVTTRS